MYIIIGLYCHRLFSWIIVHFIPLFCALCPLRILFYALRLCSSVRAAHTTFCATTLLHHRFTVSNNYCFAPILQIILHLLWRPVIVIQMTFHLIRHLLSHPSHRALHPRRRGNTRVQLILVMTKDCRYPTERCQRPFQGSCAD